MSIGSDHQFDVTVEARRDVADGVVELRLRPVAGPAPQWQPGAHLDLFLPSGLERQYSLCGLSSERAALIVAVLREPDGRGGSAWLYDELGEGDKLTVRGPRNHFALVDGPSYLFVAGGIGITPLLPMLSSVDDSGRPWRLLYGGRTRPSMAYLDELARYGERVRLAPQDETGLLELTAALDDTDADTLVYCCGPGPLLDAMEAACARRGRQLRVERFAPKVVAHGPDTEFEVECALSGITVTVPAGTSILRAVEAAGLSVLSSCQEGTCGTCETGVLEGVPDHRDSVLTRPEQDANDVMMICCGRARSARLVLEL